MTTDELLSILNHRGLTVALNDQGRPILQGGNGESASEGLLAVLKLPVHRDEIIRRLGGDPARAPPPVEQEAKPAPPPQREYLWSWGLMVRYPPEWKPPPGAECWREVGQTEWQDITP